MPRHAYFESKLPDCAANISAVMPFLVLPLMLAPVQSIIPHFQGTCKLLCHCTEAHWATFIQQESCNFSMSLLCSKVESCCVVHGCSALVSSFSNKDFAALKLTSPSRQVQGLARVFVSGGHAAPLRQQLCKLGNIALPGSVVHS